MSTNFLIKKNKRMELKDCELGKIYFRKKGIHEYLWENGGNNYYVATSIIKLVSQAKFTEYPAISIVREATISEMRWFHKCVEAKKVLPYNGILNLYGLINRKN